MSISNARVSVCKPPNSEAASEATEILSIAPLTHRDRFFLIDALRGLAALLVLFFHLWHNAGWAEVETAWPSWIGRLLTGFGSGVDIFFVISGFVIAYSVRSMAVGAKTAAYFALRRQIRLDPPYWLCTFLFWGLMASAARRTPSIHIPGIGTVLANLFYLQTVLRLPSIDPVAWTLCLEVQFYLVFIGLVWISQQTGQPQNNLIALASGLAIVGLVCNSLALPMTGWFVGSWHLFALGAVAYWTLSKQSSWVLLVILCVATVTAGLLREGWALPPLVGPFTALGVVASVHNGWDSKFQGSIFRYFAAISYSLYLIHFHLVSMIFRQGMRLTGRSGASGTMWALIAAIVVIGLANLLWHFIERPAKRWSASLKPYPSLITTRKTL